MQVQSSVTVQSTGIMSTCMAVFTYHLCPNNKPCLQRLQIHLTLMSTLSCYFQGYCHDNLQNYSLRIRSMHNSKPHIVTFNCPTAPAVPESPIRTTTELLSFFGTDHDSCNRTCLLFIRVRAPKQVTHSKESQTNV